MKPAARKIRINGDFAFVPLTQGYEATIDTADVPLVQDWSWTARVTFGANGIPRNVYAVRRHSESGVQKHVSMHRLIAGTPDGAETDHIDGNGLNNCRANLRVATKTQNRRNTRTRCDNTTGSKGVFWRKDRSVWTARIRVDGRLKHLGYFREKDAAKAAYAAASAELHGEFGRVA